MTEEPLPVHDIVGQAVGSARQLTEREREVLMMIGHGYSLVEIARKLHRSVETVKSHRRSLSRKLGTRNRVLLAQIAMRLNAGSAAEEAAPEIDAQRVVRDLLAEGVDAMGVAGIRLDAHLMVRAANEAACEWMRCAPQHMVGKFLSQLPELRQSSELFEVCSTAAASERAEHRVMELSYAGGARRFLVSVSPIVHGTVGALSDLWLSFHDLTGVNVAAIGTEARAGSSSAEMYRREAESRRRAESRLREVVAGIGWSSGIGFFRQMMRHLCQAVDVPHAVVCAKVTADSADKRLTAVAGWSRGAPVDVFDLDPSLGPGEIALSGQTCHVAEAARTHFPHAPLVQRFDAESFLALPIIGHDGSTLGLIAILDDKAMPEAFEHLPILRAFAARAAAELDRRNAEAALRAMVERHNHLADLLPSVLFYRDIDGRCVYLNGCAAEVAGRDIKAQLGMEWMRFVHPEDRQRVADACAKAHAERADIRGLVFRFVRPDGSVVPVVEGASCHVDSDGRFQGWIGSATPITPAELRMLNKLAPGGVHEN